MVVPPPTVLSARISSPWASIPLRAIVSPGPLTVELAVL